MSTARDCDVLVVGGGPAGLMAAETAVRAGARVWLAEALPSCGRKFLLAGKGGLNLTHREQGEALLARYQPLPPPLAAALADFDSAALRDWADALGVPTFVGSSGRVFPHDLKAAPLLRRWLTRLRQAGVHFALRHRWQGWDTDGALRFATPSGPRLCRAGACVLALGGASWPRLGADGAWVETLTTNGIAVRPLAPANVGFTCAFSTHLRERFAGAALKNVVLTTRDRAGNRVHAAGDVILTAYGVEGGPVYALSRPLREALVHDGAAGLTLDLLPGRALDELAAALARPRGKRSFATHLRRVSGLSGAASALLHECTTPRTRAAPRALAAALKALPLPVRAPRPLAEAISTAGGVAWEALDAQTMVRGRPGVFVAGEMLDWEAPTGGYLLTACFATGRYAGAAAARWSLGHAWSRTHRNDAR